ncbi:MAG: ATP-binding cassette domain-containing protein [Polyangiaceae bacterium]|jgi:osmoprotectant transport system ATP-binding protein
MIRVEAVEKAYGGKRVLGPLTLQVPSGRRLAIVGPSGCGKSTLLRVVLGLVCPDRGNVTIAGERMADDTKRALRRKVGYVIQDGGLFPHLTAEGNVTLLARELGWSSDRLRERVSELAAMMGLDRETLARWPVQLSGGQRQRVGVMRALMLDPEVLLLDEPFGSLDAITRGRLQVELAGLFRSLSKTVVLVTHDIAEAARLAEETVVMHDGLLVQRGTIDEMVRAPVSALVADLLAGAAT